MTAEEAYQARLRRSKGLAQDQTPQQLTSTSASNEQENKIKRMMEAMGWKGKGLGKQE